MLAISLQPFEEYLAMKECVLINLTQKPEQFFIEEHTHSLFICWPDTCSASHLCLSKNIKIQKCAEL